MQCDFNRVAIDCCMWERRNTPKRYFRCGPRGRSPVRIDTSGAGSWFDTDEFDGDGSLLRGRRRSSFRLRDSPGRSIYGAPPDGHSVGRRDVVHRRHSVDGRRAGASPRGRGVHVFVNIAAEPARSASTLRWGFPPVPGRERSPRPTSTVMDGRIWWWGTSLPERLPSS